MANRCFVQIWLVPHREVSCCFIVAVNCILNLNSCSVGALLWRSWWYQASFALPGRGKVSTFRLGLKPQRWGEKGTREVFWSFSKVWWQKMSWNVLFQCHKEATGASDCSWLDNLLFCFFSICAKSNFLSGKLKKDHFFKWENAAVMPCENQSSTASTPTLPYRLACWSHQSPLMHSVSSPRALWETNLPGSSVCMS